MINDYQRLIAWRYLRGRGLWVKSRKKGNATGGFLSFVSWIAIGGIALGVWALIVVVSVMNGFVKEVREHMLGVVSHAVVRPIGGATLQKQDIENILPNLKKNPQVLAWAPFIEQQGLISEGGRVQAVIARGIDPNLEPQVATFLQKPLSGAVEWLIAGEYQAMIGVGLSRHLGLQLGDRFTLLAPQGNFTPAGVVPRLRRFTVAGIFQSGLYEYDAGLILTHINDAAALFQMKDAIDGVRLRFDDVLKAREYSWQINRDLPPNFIVQDWGVSHSSYFRAVEIEKRMMFLILSIIIAVAAINVVNQQMMLIGEKIGDIAILRTMGVQPWGVVNIFLLQGFFLGTIGIVAGVGLGVITAWNVTDLVHGLESLFNVRFLSPEIYQIPDIPSDLQWADVALTVAVAFSITVLATLYPSYRASQILPAQALRMV